MLSQSSITQFKQIYKQEYGLSISDDEAYQLASNLVNLYKAVYFESDQEQEDSRS